MTLAPAFTAAKRAWRYAAVRRGARLHIVEFYADGSFEQRATCGQRPTQGSWRFTSNVPFANACRRCSGLFAEKEQADG